MPKQELTGGSVKILTRASARRSSIIVEKLPLPEKPRRNVSRQIIALDSEDETDAENIEKSYRSRHIHLQTRQKSAAMKPPKPEKLIDTQLCDGNLIEFDKMSPLAIEHFSTYHENPTDIKGKEELLSPVKPKVNLTPKKVGKLSKSPHASPTKLLLTPKKKKCIEDIENIGNVTPPKQRKSEEYVEHILCSPSTLLKKLDLNSPKKGKEYEKSVYQHARKALHSTVPVEMPGREKEHEELRKFIRLHLNEQSSGTLYVSGPPGTGKTASLSKIMMEPEVENQFKEVYINCTAIKSSGSIFAKIIAELGIKSGSKTEKGCAAAIEKYFEKKHQMILLVLDEIDQLESKKQSILYTIFEWPSRADYKLVLIGIANALDLTDRILPRLQARLELKPNLLHFAPYSKQQIIDIFTHRLKVAGVLDLFHPVAVQMLAGKVAAISGDVRRALDIGRRVIEIVEQRKRQEILKSLENDELCQERGTNFGQNKNTSKVIDLKHVVSVLNSVYGTSNTLGNDNEEDAFPLQQKIIICTLLLMIKKARNKDVNIGRLHDVYRNVCSKRNLLAVDQAEFVGICSLIETRGILRVSRRKEPRMHRVTLEWDDEEVSVALRDKQLMSMILQDTSVLGKM